MEVNNYKQNTQDIPKDNYTSHELGMLICNLDKKVTDGFKGVWDRQDKTNGNVMRNTEWRLTSEGSLSIIKWLVGFIGFATIANVCVNLFN